jgi:hypothetical protein
MSSYENWDYKYKVNWEAIGEDIYQMHKSHIEDDVNECLMCIRQLA